MDDVCHYLELQDDRVELKAWHGEKSNYVSLPVRAGRIDSIVDEMEPALG